MVCVLGAVYLLCTVLFVRKLRIITAIQEKKTSRRLGKVVPRLAYLKLVGFEAS